MSRQKILLAQTTEDLLRTLDYLEKSYSKVCGVSTETDLLSDDQLEVWESFLARFARASDLFMAKYLRTWVLEKEGAFRESTRDFCDYAEKKGLLESSELWMEIRELRNQIAAEYAQKKLGRIFLNRGI